MYLPRTILLLASIALAVLCIWVNASYLSARWPEYGFTYSQSWLGRLVSILCAAAVGATLPISVRSSGSLIAVTMSLVVTIPTVSLMLSQANGLTHWQLAIAATCGTVMLILSARVTESDFISRSKIPAGVVWAVTAAWFLASILLLTNYWTVMSFVGIAETYNQRAAGQSTSVWMGYVQTYYLNVLAPAMLAFGIVLPRRWLWAVAGIASFVLTYAITAQKFAVIVPLVMVGLAAAIRWRVNLTAVAILGIAALIVVAMVHFWAAGLMSFVAAIVLHRTIGIPALTLAQYYDVFSEVGFTFWSHVRGISLVLAPPESLAADPLWPNLGYIVGERALGMPENNLNANPFASDGAAAAGLVGVFVISIAMAFWIAALNVVTRMWDQRFVMLVIAPVALSLTNGPFFTVMLSFGGLFWLLLFAGIAVWRRHQA